MRFSYCDNVLRAYLPGSALRERDPGRNYKQNGTKISNNDAAVQHGSPPKAELKELRAGRVDKLGRDERTARERDRSRARKTRRKIGSPGSAITHRSRGDSSRSGSSTTCIAIFPHLSSERIPRQGSVSTCREHTCASCARLGRRGHLPLRELHEERGWRLNYIVNTKAPLNASAAATTSSPPRNWPVEVRTSPMMSQLLSALRQVSERDLGHDFLAELPLSHHPHPGSSLPEIRLPIIAKL